MWTLLHLKFQRHFKAGHGDPGRSANKTGANGEDIIIDVPLGTVVKDAETNEIILEIVEDKEQKILLKGGRGGLGNTHFKSSTNQTPRYAQPGEAGSEGWFILELKVLADVGLVGFPNAGKSTLLSVLTAAKPKIANYAFTTLQPNLGIVKYRDFKSFIMADIPGIIEGAAEGKGLGIRFLRHIERNAVLLFVIPADADDINKEYEILLNELKKYNPELLDKQRVLAISKSDLLDDELKEMIEDGLNINIPYIFISSVAQRGLTELKDLLWQKINS
jgi:GTP-binding protein